MSKDTTEDPMIQSSQAKSLAPNLERGFLILEHLAGQASGATIKELSEDLQLPNASVFRITSVLEENGYIRREVESKRYYLTNKLLKLGQPHSEQRSLSECANAEMRKLRNVTGETTQLCCLIENEMVLVDQLPALHAFKYTADLGARCPLHSCAPGKAILAFKPKEERDQILDMISFKKYTETTITNKKDFIKELNTIRKIGYALDRAEGMIGIHCVSAPILDSHGFAVAGITITGPVTRVFEDEFETLGEIVAQCAHQISLELSK